ncbi:glutamine-synthetase adenylyltransferase [Palleronia caenipelagi]|uniref:Glutamine-synthetase adenylyltransferase n=1 Tax=Palleronia caenipelagi TaxID=2489174 RepID=A0A547PXN3_9RHOB|nr:glutamine-synthetase adenylyltransferase [Palleronia caenipelagi]TRD18892.1 glutamine-synthetase adenylyltransferase [Palleronia caenipelagi]
MSLSDRITACPRPHEPERAAETQALLADLPARLRDLCTGVSGCSPYLRDLMAREADWLAEIADQPPEVALEAELGRLDAEDDQLAGSLRQAKCRVALLSALCDCGGVWPLEDVTGALTRLADKATHVALVREVGAEIRRGRLPGREGDPVAGGMFALAMGKMGAFELNYSSDIDLICLFDEGYFEASDVMEARSSFVKATRRAMALLSETREGGYVFRTDLRLRPNPSVTPVCLGMEAAERYYESLGRSWERAAHIKARVCAGDAEAGARYLETLRPFVWRRHLDFAAIEDAHDIRQKIREHKGLTGKADLPGHDMKLGRGGIREIEFFTQTRQIIAGGRDESLRVRGTVEGLARLADAGWVEADVARQLTDDYRAHRTIEHRLQMIADRQTHALPDDPAGFARLADFCDRDEADLMAEIAERLDRVSALTEPFFKPKAPRPEGPELSQSQQEIVDGWRAVPALRSTRAREIFKRILPELLAALLASPEPDKAMLHFDGFIRGLPAGVQLFSLFEANPGLLSLIADISATSEDLATYLSRNAAVLDAVIGGAFFDDWPGCAALEAELSDVLAKAGDYERQLDAARKWQRDWHFRVGVHLLRGLTDGRQAGAQYADLAEAVVRAVWPAVIAEFSTRHGPPPGEGAMVLGMGALGAGSLTTHSDLDVIVIYDADGLEESVGKRPLPARTYYARLTKALVTALSAPTGAGRLYEVDMRLRPSGKQGPVATALTGFASYQREEAWTWEHQALTRARPIAGPEPLCDRVLGICREVIASDQDHAKLRQDTREMLDRLAGAKPGSGWNVKDGPGGLAAIELVAAMLGLMAGAEAQAPVPQIEAAAEAGLIGKQQAAGLAASHRDLRAIQVAMRLLSEGALDPERIGAAGAAVLLREGQSETLEALQARLTEIRADAAQVILEMLQDEG